MIPQALTAPSSAAERQDFRRLFEKRIQKVKAKTADVFAFKKTGQPPFLVDSVLYSAFGLDPEMFPDEYFNDPATMTN